MPAQLHQAGPGVIRQTLRPAAEAAAGQEMSVLAMQPESLMAINRQRLGPELPASHDQRAFG